MRRWLWRGGRWAGALAGGSAMGGNEHAAEVTGVLDVAAGVGGSAGRQGGGAVLRLVRSTSSWEGMRLAIGGFRRRRRRRG